MQMRAAADQRRRSTFSLRKNLAAMELVMTVSEAAAGPTSERLRWLRAKSSEKKARARKKTPAKKSGQVRTARMAPERPEWARISSRSPIDFIAAAVRTSPAVDARTIAAIMQVAATRPEAARGLVALRRVVTMPPLQGGQRLGAGQDPGQVA